MQKERKPIYKTLLFWQIVIPLVLVLAIVVYIGHELSKPMPQPTNPTDHGGANGFATEPAGTTAPTEPLLPVNPYGPFDFAMDGDYLTCTAGESMLGIDVSFWQGNINWQQVKDAGIEFAMIRIGWRGSEQGILAEDDFVHSNYAGATAAGLKVGGYFFSQAISVEEAVEEANYLLSIIDGWDVQMPIVFDWEYIDETSRTGRMDPRTLTDCTKAFCQTIEDAGYEAMIYFNANQSHKQMFLDELQDYRFWLAQYSTTLQYPHKIDMWQYSDQGSVPGIECNVDLNLYFVYE